MTPCAPQRLLRARPFSRKRELQRRETMPQMRRQPIDALSEAERSERFDPLLMHCTGKCQFQSKKREQGLVRPLLSFRQSGQQLRLSPLQFFYGAPLSQILRRLHPYPHHDQGRQGTLRIQFVDQLGWQPIGGGTERRSDISRR